MWNCRDSGFDHGLSFGKQFFKRKILIYRIDGSQDRNLKEYISSLRNDGAVKRTLYSSLRRNIRWLSFQQARQWNRGARIRVSSCVCSLPNIVGSSFGARSVKQHCFSLASAIGAFSTRLQKSTSSNKARAHCSADHTQIIREADLGTMSRFSENCKGSRRARPGFSPTHLARSD